MGNRDWLARFSLFAIFVWQRLRSNERLRLQL
uniref:Uncharacterized protein n=1 Tax=Anguilla anguilla TaxID=7936 RepID=A0A0E9PCW6_ANGAN